MGIARKLLIESRRQLSKLPQSVGIQLRRAGKAQSKKLSPREARNLRERMADCIARKGGQATSSLLAARLALQYTELDTAGRQDFLQLLSDGFDIDPAKAEKALRVAAGTAKDELRNAAATLRRTLVPPRVELFRQWTLMQGGVKFLVDFRTDVLAAIESGIPLKPLNADLREFLESLFSAGILQMRTIDWDSPASLLEKLIRYEAVHAIQGWDDLRNRLDSDRRCFAFFHPNMPGALSPLPGFRRWLESEDGRAFLAALPAAVLRNAGCGSAEIFWQTVQAITPAGAASVPVPFRELMRSLAAHYLTAVRHPGRNTACDPVAHFHLSNGSRIEQINWGANLTERGIRESFGLMVNYRYKLDDIQRHHEDYVSDGTVHVSRQVRGLHIKHG